MVNLGHGVAEIAGAIGDQARTLGYVNGTAFTHEPVEELAAELAAAVAGRPGAGLSAGERLRGGRGGAQAGAAVLGRVGAAAPSTRCSRSRLPITATRSWPCPPPPAPHYSALFRRLAGRGRAGTGTLRLPLRVPGHAAVLSRRAAATRSRRPSSRAGPDTVAALIAEPVGGSSTGASVPATGVLAAGAGDLRPARRAARRGRGADRCRPDRHLVGAGAVWRRAGHHDARQGNRGRLRAALRGRHQSPAIADAAGTRLGCPGARADLFPSPGALRGRRRHAALPPRASADRALRRDGPGAAPPPGGAARPSAAWATCGAAGSWRASSSWRTRRPGSRCRGVRGSRRHFTDGGTGGGPGRVAQRGARRRSQRRPGDAGAALHRHRGSDRRNRGAVDPGAAATRPTGWERRDDDRDEDHLHLRHRGPGRVPPPFDEALDRGPGRSRRDLPQPDRRRAGTRAQPSRSTTDRRSTPRCCSAALPPPGRRRSTSRSGTAKEAQRDWARQPWQERVEILRRAAALIRERKYDLAALMALEVGQEPAGGDG